MITIKYRQLEQGYFILPGQGIHFAFRHGKYTFAFPVIDGKIHHTSHVFPFPEEKVELIEPKDMEAYGLSEETLREFQRVRVSDATT